MASSLRNLLGSNFSNTESQPKPESLKAETSSEETLPLPLSVEEDIKNSQDQKNDDISAINSEFIPEKSSPKVKSPKNQNKKSDAQEKEKKIVPKKKRTEKKT